MAEWRTHRTQNAAGNRIGSSPIAATQVPEDDLRSFLLRRRGVKSFFLTAFPRVQGRKVKNVSKLVSRYFKKTDI